MREPSVGPVLEHVLEYPLVVTSDRATGVLPAGSVLRAADPLLFHGESFERFTVVVNVEGAPLPTSEARADMTHPLSSRVIELRARASDEELLAILRSLGVTRADLVRVASGLDPVE